MKVKTLFLNVLKMFFAVAVFVNLNACFSDSNSSNVSIDSGMSKNEQANFSESNILKDARDGRNYKTTTIGTQVWMAENVNVNIPGSICYDNEPTCDFLGRLYTWEAAQNVCPTGWHLPSIEDFKTLLDNVGARDDERSSNLRVAVWKHGLDSYGFSARAAGFYDPPRGFVDLGYFAKFWSFTECALSIQDYTVGIECKGPDSDSGRSYSVRCLKD